MVKYWKNLHLSLRRSVNIENRERRERNIAYIDITLSINTIIFMSIICGGHKDFSEKTIRINFAEFYKRTFLVQHPVGESK